MGIALQVFCQRLFELPHVYRLMCFMVLNASGHQPEPRRNNGTCNGSQLAETME